MLRFEDPISRVPLVGPKYEKLLEKLEIKTVKDLLYHFPFRYDDYSITKNINQLRIQDKVTIIGTIQSTKNIFTKSGKKMTSVTIIDDTSQIDALWFNQIYLSKTLTKDLFIAVSGEVSFFGDTKVFMSPDFEVLKTKNDIKVHTGRIVPVYPETYGVSSKWLRSRINHILSQNLVEFKDALPEFISQEMEFLPVDISIKQIHFPKKLEEVTKPQARFAFEELFKTMLVFEAIKSKNFDVKPPKIFESKDKEISKLIKSLPFPLTNSQDTAIKEILSDMVKPHPMNRLLQGDVGSGKTIVALMAAYLCYLNGVKTYFLAPTEILATQHYDTFRKVLTGLGINVTLTSGSNHAESNKLDEGSWDINIGTHALFYKNQESTPKRLQKIIKNKSSTKKSNSNTGSSLTEKNVGLVIIDEQHKFGVEQRNKLLESALSCKPHLLTMSATPIPRTMALTIYGDLDVSALTDMPKGRKQIVTWVVPNNKKVNAYEWVSKQIKESKLAKQAFVVCPLIEESESESLKNVQAATKEFENLASGVFRGLKTDLIHGRLKNDEKKLAMDDFRNGKTNILVATPIIEVGIDVPSATIVVIEAAERFGLASLHQIRGRVGRGDEKSYCLLFSNLNGGGGLERLKLLEQHHNGLELAEADLVIRGPGELIGKSQHGRFNFRFADLTNLEYIKQVKDFAKQTINQIRKDPSEHSELYKLIKSYNNEGIN